MLPLGEVLTFISRQPKMMQMQGTLALELLQQAKHLDAILVCVSGGGMISGIATAAKGLNPNITVLAAEPSGMCGSACVCKYAITKDIRYADAHCCAIHVA